MDLVTYVTALRDAATKAGVELYNVDGRMLFEIRDERGHPINQYVSYLVKKVGEEWFRFGFETTQAEMDAIAHLHPFVENKIAQAKRQFDEFLADPEIRERATMNTFYPGMLEKQ